MSCKELHLSVSHVTLELIHVGCKLGCVLLDMLLELSEVQLDDIVVLLQLRQGFVSEVAKGVQVRPDLILVGLEALHGLALFQAWRLRDCLKVRHSVIHVVVIGEAHCNGRLKCLSALGDRLLVRLLLLAKILDELIGLHE
jgi:hypothetical protein